MKLSSPFGCLSGLREENNWIQGSSSDLIAKQRMSRTR